jgi:hypothetical protein
VIRLRRLLWAAAFPASAGLLGAQDDPSPAPAPPAVHLATLRLSGPPALTLLGTSLSDVQRPGTPRELIASLVSGTGADGIVPDSYAMETAPFWLTRHRALTLREYHNASLIDRLRYFTAFSFAASRPRPDSSGVQPDARVAAAVRTLLFNGRPSVALLEVADEMRERQVRYIELYRRWEAASEGAAGLDELRERLALADATLSSLVVRVTAGQQSSLRDSAMRTLARRDSLRALVALAEREASNASEIAADLDRVDAALEILAKRFVTREADPDGFTLEIAGGIRGDYENGEWSRGRTDRAGVWLTPMYRLGEKNVEVVAVLRYLSNVRRYGGDDLLDLGGRISLDVGKGSVSAEHVWRRASDPETDRSRHSRRWAFLFDYPLGGRLRAAASFGSDYRRAEGDRPVIATVGIDVGFGAIEILTSR